MAKLPLVHCRLCKEPIDRNTTEKGKDWIMPSRNFYYHTDCYNSWKGGAALDNDDNEIWHDLIYDFIARDLKGSYNYFLCEKQIQNFLSKNNYTTKGIYFALKYFYELKKNSWDKSNGGIGIVPYVYDESIAYWITQERKEKGIVAAIEKQIKERAATQPVVIHKKKKTAVKKKFSLDSVGDEI